MPLKYEDCVNLGRKSLQNRFPATSRRNYIANLWVSLALHPLDLAEHESPAKVLPYNGDGTQVSDLESESQ